MTIKILNLYAGIGGNRKLWVGDIEVTAIENNFSIAGLYRKFFPKDNVIIADAHHYLLEHFKEFDFIWSSPPCQTHSDIRRMAVDTGRVKPVYPNLKLYDEIIFLKHFFKGKWVVENVTPYYKPLIKPQIISRHCFWSNFPILKIKLPSGNIKHQEIQPKYGFDLRNIKVDGKRTLLRNLVNPKLGLHILEMALRKPQLTLFNKVETK